jgi:ribosomal protein S6
MFLLDAVQASKDWTATEKHVLDILKRYGAEVITSEKWGDRKLSYEIKHQKRAVYLLVHFKAPGDAIAKVRADCRLSETILRVLIIVDDPTMQLVPEAELAAITAATMGPRREREGEGRVPGVEAGPAKESGK